MGPLRQLTELLKYKHKFVDTVDKHGQPIRKRVRRERLQARHRVLLDKVLRVAVLSSVVALGVLFLFHVLGSANE